MSFRRFFLASMVAGALALAAQPTTPKVRIEVFSDFQCPACKILYEGTLQQVKRNYVQTGKVGMTHRNYPLPQHAFGRQAATYAVAAEKIGKYDAVATALFAHQDQWSQNGNLDSALAGVLSAAELEKVHKLSKEPSVAAEIDRDVKTGQAVPITQTPTMIIYAGGNRYPVSGPVSYDVLQRALDSLLSK